MAGALPGMGPPVTPECTGGNGTLLMVLAIGQFVRFERFAAQAQVLSGRIKTTPTADSFAEVLPPGEPEMRARRERQATGIPMPEATWQDIQAPACELNVTLPAPASEGAR